MRVPSAVLGLAFVASAGLPGTAVAGSGCADLQGDLVATVIALPADGQPLQVALQATATTGQDLVIVSTADGTPIARGTAQPGQPASVATQVGWLPGTGAVGGYALHAAAPDGSLCPQSLDSLSAQEIWGAVIAAVDQAGPALVAALP